MKLSIPHIAAWIAVILSLATCASLPYNQRGEKRPAAFYLAGDSTTAVQSSGGGAGGDWAKVIDAVKNSISAYTPYVTIQFGHNDQKASANISIEEYSANLKELALEAKATGARPILVTPLSRRNYNSSGLIIEDLAPQRNATIQVARSNGIDFIDLNAASTKYLNSIGKAKAVTYNLHLMCITLL
ncbi:carbohydrate esterase family 12 protein [Hyaloscypha hepaticicola]|uniref:Carbohydrate esterase family 12 protein n=1 Tax=Hyaloscypha hepaticicola TaxID=2082293 RepID=A0A2J6PUT7_9HELO|nr:carbohydrate esterase family 12 protein [Hyaloscypha hepaticicola]